MATKLTLVLAPEVSDFDALAMFVSEVVPRELRHTLDILINEALESTYDKAFSAGHDEGWTAGGFAQDTLAKAVIPVVD